MAPCLPGCFQITDPLSPLCSSSVDRTDRAAAVPHTRKGRMASSPISEQTSHLKNSLGRLQILSDPARGPKEQSMGLCRAVSAARPLVREPRACLSALHSSPSRSSYCQVFPSHCGPWPEPHPVFLCVGPRLKGGSACWKDLRLRGPWAVCWARLVSASLGGLVVISL